MQHHQGYCAAGQGEELSANPYPPKSWQANWWRTGWYWHHQERIVLDQLRLNTD